MNASPQRPAEVEDLELVRRFKNGDESAFDQLVRNHRPRIFAVLYRLVRNREDANDLSQDVFIRVFRSLSKFREESRLSTWLYRIAVNLAFNHLRRRRRVAQSRVEVPVDEETMLELPTQSTPQGDFHQSELRQAIRTAVESLPERQRAVFVLRQYDGLKNQEIAQVLGCAAGTVKAHYFFAVRRLQQHLKGWVP
jgi:RNA polymerase sigma-70 factor (ECF subfamily)